MPIQFSTFRGAGNGGNLIECILRPAGQQCTLRPFAILNLWNSNSLTVGAVKRPILHQCTKFRKDRSNRCGDIAIFVIFQDCGRSHLGFSKIQNFNGWSRVRGHRDQGSCVVVLNFLKIGRTVADKWWFNFFFKMAAVRHLGFVGNLLGPPTMNTWRSLSLSQIWLKSML